MHKLTDKCCSAAAALPPAAASCARSSPASAACTGSGAVASAARAASASFAFPSRERSEACSMDVTAASGSCFSIDLQGQAVGMFFVAFLAFELHKFGCNSLTKVRVGVGRGVRWVDVCHWQTCCVQQPVAWLLQTSIWPLAPLISNITHVYTLAQAGGGHMQAPTEQPPLPRPHGWPAAQRLHSWQAGPRAARHPAAAPGCSSGAAGHLHEIKRLVLSANFTQCRLQMPPVTAPAALPRAAGWLWANKVQNDQLTAAACVPQR